MERSKAEKLFLDKMVVLNKTFLHFIQCSLREMPDADLSPSVRDYLNHVEELDRTYGGIETVCNGGSTMVTESAPKKDEEVVLSSMSKTCTAMESDTNNDNETNAKVSATETVSSSLSKIPLFSITTTPTDSPTIPKISFDISTASSTDSERRGKKRAKRGGPEEGDNEVVISNHNTPTSARYATSAERYPIQIGQAAQSPKFPSFLNSSITGNVLRTSFSSAGDSTTKVEKEITQKKDITRDEGSESNKRSLFSFGQKESSKKSDEFSRSSPKFLFGQLPSKDTEHAEKVSEKNEQNEQSTSRPSATPIFSFLKPVVTEKSGNTTEVLDSSKASSDFKFGAPPAVQPESNNESEEGEYVPPKPEAVMTEEPNAIFSSKCSVFVLKGNEYEKLGVGQLHIKKDETGSAKKILLIRAATATGTVWVNSYIDDTMKHVNIEDVKLRVSCVSNGSPGTYLIRLPNKEDREKVVEQIAVKDSTT